jgi:uncharacterized protein YcbK (DUF882 family)
MKYLFVLTLFFSFYQTCRSVNDTETGKSSRVGFYLNAGGERTNLKVFSLFVLPGEKITLKVTGGNAVTAEAKEGMLKTVSENDWMFTAPDRKGIYDVTFTDKTTGGKMLLHVFVMIPASKVKNGMLNGYRIGEYPESGYKNYKNPEGFVEVTKENGDVNISPHFKLKQFLCKQKGGWPKYVVINPRMVRKLELMLEKLNETGADAKTFVLMSAYRTPYYNKSIGNVKYSRHVFGDAIDLYVDDDGDGRIDDLNNDGKINMKDARVIAGVVEQIERDPKYKEFVGGMGVYKKNSQHTYFVHVDTRGFRARW